ncbi:Carboxylesterase NlhH [Zhongshania aliphaticivorans]|uniref:Carboxylesterase NlhH n=1 Tax=Zhongshania aliphaticivorans TaxID=1470434 RepID=A0A5S9NIT9_9GAMM|nr:alpha/beta hydrolase [Zhongshania aliphaticivorans]CAA0090236.1 Carboxylesterase NlhH [Zhongshania aliphaticivorans]CAA0097632.1 Carboxylesterase NlhH [Zhongshania aliphaticivorans]
MNTKFKATVIRKAIKVSCRMHWLGKTAKHIDVRHSHIDTAHGSIPLRIYQPPGEGPFPVVVYYHGGGWVIGDLGVYDPMCRDLCNRSDCIVVAVDYRLAPEHPFPAAPEDCLAALKWTYEHIELYGGLPNAIVVAGDSAGGNLAAVTALQARECLPNVVKGQVLIYPVTDHYEPGTPSYLENANGPVLTRKLMIWFWDTYLKNSSVLEFGQTRHPRATPLARNDLDNLPPTLLITAGRDPLRDDGANYAMRLEQFDNTVQYSLYADSCHGFVGLQGPKADHIEATEEISTWLGVLFSA